MWLVLLNSQITEIGIIGYSKIGTGTVVVEEGLTKYGQQIQTYISKGTQNLNEFIYNDLQKLLFEDL